jgi:manganese transport protein
VILEGFGGQRIPLVVRRLIALIPALAILAVGLDTTQALVLSQVELSFGIPFAFWPLVRLTRDRILMGDLVNDRTTTLAAVLVAAAITALNIVLIVLLLR